MITETLPLPMPGSRMLTEEWTLSRQVFNCVSNGITIADATLPNLPLIYVNPAFERLTGYTASEVLGQSCSFLQGSETQQQGLMELRRALRDHTDIRVALRNYRKDGSLFWNELYLSPIRDEAGSVSHYVGIQNDITAYIQETARLTHRADHDSLTGLVNRSLLMDRLEQAILRARRNGESLAILFFDLNGFKVVNDTYGHDVGDAMLQVAAQRLRAAVREHETVGRLGGDEFIAILEAVDGETAGDARAATILDRLGSPMLLGELTLSTSASVGVALFPRDASTGEDLLRYADQAMYLDKHRQKVANRLLRRA